MKTIIMLILLLAGTAAWAGDCPDVLVQEDISLDQFKGDPWCRHKALFVAVIYGEYYPVRFQIGPIKCGGQHVQAQAFIDNEWKWLNLDVYGRPWVSKTHNEFFTPEKTVSIDEYITKERSLWGWTSETWKVPNAMALHRMRQAEKAIRSGGTNFMSFKR